MFRNAPFISALALIAAPLFADTVFLTNGATVEGRARYSGGKVIVEQLAGDVIFDESRVEAVDKKRTLLDDYDDKLKALTNNPNSTADEFAALARYCEENGIKRHVEQTYRRAIAKDSNHAEARIALGYVKHEGLWMSPERANVAKGLVEYKGTWMTPEAKADLLRLEAQTEAAKALAEVERLKLERTERQLEAIEAERDMRFERGRDYNDGYVVGVPSYWYRPGFGRPGHKPDRPGKPTTPPQNPNQGTGNKLPRVGESMYPPGSVGGTLFPRE